MPKEKVCYETGDTWKFKYFGFLSLPTSFSICYTTDHCLHFLFLTLNRKSLHNIHKPSLSSLLLLTLPSLLLTNLLIAILLILPLTNLHFLTCLHPSFRILISKANFVHCYEFL